MSIAGQSMSCEVDRSGQRSKLAVSAVGPAKKIGTRSVAVAFGNSVVILSAGEEDEASRLKRRSVYGCSGGPRGAFATIGRCKSTL